MSKQPIEVPEEAVELYREAGQGASVFEDDTDPDYIDLISDAAVKAAAPSLRAQGAEEAKRGIREALGVEDVQNQIAAAIGRIERDEITIEQMASEIYAALLQGRGPSEAPRVLAAGISDEDRERIGEIEPRLREVADWLRINLARRESEVAFFAADLLRKLATPKEEADRG